MSTLIDTRFQLLKAMTRVLWRAAEVSRILMLTAQRDEYLAKYKRDEVDAVLKKGDVRLGIAPSPGQTMIRPSLAGRFRLNSVSMRWHLRAMRAAKGGTRSRSRSPEGSLEPGTVHCQRLVQCVLTTKPYEETAEAFVKHRFLNARELGDVVLSKAIPFRTDGHVVLP